MPPPTMHLEVLLPSRVFAERRGVTRMVVETLEGSHGLLPHRRDCIAALAPGLLLYETEEEGEVCMAVDEGVLIKTGLDVRVSVRRAVASSSLSELRAAVDEEFRILDTRERSVRAIMTKLETGVLRRLVAFRHER